MRAMGISFQDSDLSRGTDLLLRLTGAGLLALFAAAMRGCCRLAQESLQHPATPLELTVATIACAALMGGIALLFEGAGLFRPVPLPPRPMFF